MKRVQNDAEQLKYLPYIFGIIIIVGAILVATGGLNLNFIKLGAIAGADTSPPSGEGFTVLSVSADTNTISNDADLNTANFIITTAATGSGQSLVGRFDDNIVNKFTNLIIKYPLKITAGAVQETITYPIRNDGSSGDIYKYELKAELRKDYWTGATCALGRQGWLACIAVVEVTGIDNAALIGGNDAVYKIFKNRVGGTGSLDNANVDYSIPITITVNGIPYTKTIQSRGMPENAGTSSAEFRTATGTWIASVQWSGSMVTGQATPQPSLYKATHIDGASKWNIASSSTYKTYTDTAITAESTTGFVQKLNNAKDACGLAASWESKASLIQKCNDALNAVQSGVNGQVRTADNLLNENTAISYTATTTDVFTTTGTPYNSDGSGSVVQTSSRKITIPVLTFTIKAKEIAVLAPVGLPEIISITIPTFASGDANGLATVRIKNIGTGTGTFQAAFSDPSGTFTQSGNTLGSRITLGAGQEGDISVYIGHGTVASEVSKTLTFRVSDVNSGKYIERTAIASMTAPKACTPNTTKQNGQIVSQCKPDGSGYTTLLDCTGKVVDYVNGVPVCKTVSGGGSGGAETNNTNADSSMNAEKVNWYDTTPAKILAGLIIVLVILLVWRKQNE